MNKSRHIQNWKFKIDRNQYRLLYDLVLSSKASTYTLPHWSRSIQREFLVVSARTLCANFWTNLVKKICSLLIWSAVHCGRTRCKRHTAHITVSCWYLIIYRGLTSVQPVVLQEEPCKFRVNDPCVLHLPVTYFPPEIIRFNYFQFTVFQIMYLDLISQTKALPKLSEEDIYF